MNSAKVIVCGADWCHDTIDTLKQLDDFDVAYSYVDIEQDPKAAAWVREQNNGAEKKPTVDVDGLILSVPDEAELAAALRSKGLIG